VCVCACVCNPNHSFLEYIFMEKLNVVVHTCGSLSSYSGSRVRRTFD
jgi:hypothetical protein